MTAAAYSETFIANLALGRIGSTQTIGSLTENSNTARVCALWYPQDRDVLLADFPWPWAQGYQQIAQVAGPESTGNVANSQWARSYRYPADGIKLRRLTDTPPTSTTVIPQTTGTLALYPTCVRPWKRADGDPFPYPFEVGSDATGRLIFTDSYGCGYGLTAVYTRKVEDTSQFSADFVDALAWRLAADLAMALGFDDKKREFATQQYNSHARSARATALNESQSDQPWMQYQSEVIRRRWIG